MCKENNGCVYWITGLSGAGKSTFLKALVGEIELESGKVIKDKLKSNLQTYLGMKTVVDSKAESALKKLQAESENVGRDEKTAIELGKITTAKFALFSKIRKVGANYVIAVDFTDLTTGEQLASLESN